MGDAVWAWLAGIAANLLTAFLLYAAAARVSLSSLEDWKVARRLQFKIKPPNEPASAQFTLVNKTEQSLAVAAIEWITPNGLRSRQEMIRTGGDPEEFHVSVGMSFQEYHRSEISIIYGLTSGNAFRQVLRTGGNAQRRLRRYHEYSFLMRFRWLRKLWLRLVKLGLITIEPRRQGQVVYTASPSTPAIVLVAVLATPIVLVLLLFIWQTR